MSKKIKIVFVSEAIRRDSEAPLRLFKEVQPIHLYLNAPYSDMTAEDLNKARQVNLDNLFNEIIKAKPDVIQGPEPFGSKLMLKLAYICQKAVKKTGAKLIIPVLENRPIKERFNLTQRLALRVFCPNYFRLADAVVVLNKGAITNVKAYEPKAKIVKGIVWGVWGVDTELFKPAEKESGLAVYAGRWVEDKGLKYLLEAVKIASKKLKNFKLKLFGQGPYESSMRQFVKENKLEDIVEFIGQVKNTELPKYLAKAELSIYPSITQKRWEEQVGTVNFQAMSAAAVALTTKSGAIPEYLKDGEGAILVEERSSEALADGIIRYFSSKDKAKMQAAAREFIMRYDIKGEIAKAEKLIKKISDEN